MFIDLLEMLKSQLNFTYTITKPADLAYGTLINGSWNGVIKELDENNIDLAICDLTVTKERAEVVDFTVGLIKIANKLYMKKPERDFSWTTFIDVFNHRLMIALMILLVVLSFAVYFTFFYFFNDDVIITDFGTSQFTNNTTFRCVFSPFTTLKKLVFTFSCFDITVRVPTFVYTLF